MANPNRSDAQSLGLPSTGIHKRTDARRISHVMRRNQRIFSLYVTQFSFYGSQRVDKSRENPSAEFSLYVSDHMID